MKSTIRSGSCAAIAITIFLHAALAAPAWAGLTGYGIQITATNSDGVSGTFDLPCGNQSIDTVTPIMSADQTQTLGYIDTLDVSYDGDPLVNLNFSMTAGTSTTTFAINSAIVTFSPLLNPNGVALVNGTLTDHNDGSVTLTGLFPGGKAYEADYNPTTSVVDWADLVATTTVGATGSFSGRQPATSTQLISDTLQSIQSHFDFTLSATDSASATSQFNISGGTRVPEPSTLTLFAAGLAGLGLAKVRARRKNRIAGV